MPDNPTASVTPPAPDIRSEPDISSLPLSLRHDSWRSNAWLLMPLASIIVFFVVMGLVLWNLAQREQQLQANTLHRNVMWAQQQIQLTAASAQQQLQALAHEIAAGHNDTPAAFEAATRTIIQQHPEITRISINHNHNHNHSAASGNPVWLPPTSDDSGNYSLTLHVPVCPGAETRSSGKNKTRSSARVITAVFSVTDLLRHALPPELMTKYRISLLDARRQELASTSTRPLLPNDTFEDLPLGAPAHGLIVRAYAYAQLAWMTNGALTWLVAGLSCFILWNLWSLWRHSQQRFRTQQALYAEAFFRRAMENSVRIGMRALDLRGRITHVNSAFCQMTGWSESDLVGQAPPFPYWPHDAHAQMQGYIDMTLQGKTPPSGLEMRVRRKDDSVFYARLFSSPLIDSTGQQTGWMSTMTDITEPKRVREELAASHQRFTMVLESLDAAVSVIATDGSGLLFANRYYRNLFGTQTIHDDADFSIPSTSGAAPTQEQEIYVARLQKWFDVRHHAIQWVDGHPAQIQIATDITTRMQMQEIARQQNDRLQFTSRLVTMGEMASLLAHELNQPLAAINNYCSGATALVKAQRATPEALLHTLGKASQQAIRAGMIIRRIRGFVKRNEPRRQSARITDIIGDAVELAAIETHQRRIRIVTDIRSRMPLVYVDPVLIEQVLVNLLKNAAEAMVAARQTRAQSQAKSDQVIRVVVRRESGHVHISVIDQGTGVNEAATESLFEPFHSTKIDGMGMGLNICRSIIESHHGSLWAVNNMDDRGNITGATFHCRLPIGEPAGIDADSVQTGQPEHPTLTEKS